ncbi:protein of unknown function [Legionella hackeliae]|uniref:Uncharacterized protein n=1 Tax=Legionella hackeliae TaxID=449 RepID=A0A0A8UUI9_LEGHA|nr:protein of unknown function [Legionella hackeliae]
MILKIMLVKTFYLKLFYIEYPSELVFVENPSLWISFLFRSPFLNDLLH